MTTAPGLTRLLDATERTAVAERLLEVMERAAKRTGAPVTMEGGLKVWWMAATPISAAGFVYYDYDGRMSREHAVRCLFEWIIREQDERNSAEVRG
ncbi:MAG: hypothetical protein HW375_22 [Anaerolineales bacterium]|nr:hypothetical protein [Anaerolineales bacterium]